jgi:hypothetical protein
MINDGRRVRKIGRLETAYLTSDHDCVVLTASWPTSNPHYLCCRPSCWSRIRFCSLNMNIDCFSDQSYSEVSHLSLQAGRKVWALPKNVSQARTYPHLIAGQKPLTVYNSQRVHVDRQRQSAGAQSRMCALFWRAPGIGCCLV